MRYRALITLTAAATLFGCGGDDSGDNPNVPDLRGPETGSAALFFTYPLDDQQDVAPNAPVVFNFGAALNVAPENFQFTDADGEPVAFDFSVVDDGRGVVLRPRTKLDAIADYQVVLQGIDANGEEVRVPDGALNFTTRAALEGPVALQKESPEFEVASIFPDDESQFKTMDFSAFRLRTSHPMDEETVVYGDTVSLTRDGQLVPAVLLSAGNAITVDPLNDMTPGVDYVLRVDGVVSRFGDTIAPFERTVNPMKTSSPTGKRETLVTKVPPADPNLGCLADNVRVSPLTGEPINCVPVIGTLLEDQTVSKQTGNVFGELAFPPAFPDVTPLRVARGSKLVGDALEVIIGGQVPVGFNSGDVTVEMIADATGYLFPNPTSDSPNAAKNLRLFLDLATTTDDARANGAFTQNLLHVELVGRAIVRNGVLQADAISVVEPRVLGVENSYGLLSFRMESYRDQTSAPDPLMDITAPRLQAVVGDDGSQRLSWQPGEFADRMVPGEPIVLLFSEALDPLSIVGGDTLRLTKGGASEPFTWKLDGNALVITPEDPVNYGVQYDVTATAGITDLSGNPLQPINLNSGGDTLSFSLPDYVESDGGDSVIRGPFAMTVYPGFPCATSDELDLNAFSGMGSQGVCLSSSPESEQVEVDRMPITDMPANRAIRVRFSQNMDPASIELGRTFIVEEVDGGAVSGSLDVSTRGLSFTPDQPWEPGTLYRYTLASQTSGCSDAICSEDQLPLQTALLLGNPRDQGGPDMDIVFRGAPATDSVFQELNNLPSVDVNNNFAVDNGESPVTDDSAPVPPNATRILPNEGGAGDENTGGGLVTAANTGCGFEGTPPYAESDFEQCDAQRLLYIAGALNTEILGFVEAEDLPDYIDSDQGGVAVRILPTTVGLTNLDATAVIGVDLNAADGDTTLATLPALGDALNTVLEGLGDIPLVGGILDTILGPTQDIGLIPIETATGPNIMRVRYEPDANNERTEAPVGYILPGDNPGAGDPPKFVIQFDLLFDAPALSLPLGLDHNVKSLPIDEITLEGILDFLPDGRLFIGLENLQPKEVNLDITLGPFSGGQVRLRIPENGINLSYQSVSIKKSAQED
ncbi:MAG TPA: Ig-like domain-containing protein [Alcanivorax sp.]|nr:Ig-like domain-containing protein [Alcanivorax sp.]